MKKLFALLLVLSLVLALSVQAASAEEGAPTVYFTADISPEGLQRVYDALNWTPGGKLAVKVSTGEPPASNYLRAELIGPLVQSIGGTIVECNTAYGGSRASSALHKQVAADHGFTSFADFDLMDEEGEVQWPVTGGKRLEYAIVGSHAENYSDWLILSHFKGHAMAGFGGAIKNVAIGMSSPSGKVYVHSAGTRTSGSIMHSDQDAWLEALGEMVTAVRDHVGEAHIVYINVMNRLSVDCDCDGNPAEPDIHDIGILASTDPVALDQACIDLVWQAEGNESLVRRIESRDGLHTLEYAAEIGLGSRMPKGSAELTRARKEEILAACRKLYETMSFKEITLKEIGQQTSFTRTSIYNYFETKEEIFLALFGQEYELLPEDLDGSASGRKA